MLSNQQLEKGVIMFASMPVDKLLWDILAWPNAKGSERVASL